MNDISAPYFYYNFNDEEYSFGCPILSLETFKIIGLYQKKNYGILIKNIIDTNDHKKGIHLIYKSKGSGYDKIFGEKFVINNHQNLYLIIKGYITELRSTYFFDKGKNDVKIIIKNKLTNLEGMFANCTILRDIKGLEYLDTNEVNNFSNMFFGCSSLSNIKALENWNVSNGNNFSNMFFGCSSLSSIKALENWNVSNVNNFSYMFYGCLSLSDLKGLQNWNVSKGNNFK